MNGKKSDSVPEYYLYVLVAASAVGKSVLLHKMKEEKLWEPVNKYSTRDVRGPEDDVKKIDDNTITTSNKVELRLARAERLKEMCSGGKGRVYYKNGNFYGFIYAEIIETLKTNNAVIIVSDFESIKELKERPELKGRVRVLYIASTIDERQLLDRYREREQTRFNIDSEETKKVIDKIDTFGLVLGSAVRLNYLDKIEEIMPLLNEEWNSILPYFNTIKTRAANIRRLYNGYIENISLIDYCLLNFYKLEYMYAQTRNIINSNTSPKRQISYPPVFMVCAAPSSGKATLMEIVGDLGEIENSIRITTKYAKREPRPDTDKRDGMIAIGKNAEFRERIKNEKDIWEWQFHQPNGVQYAVDLNEIRMNIDDGVPQIFISNMKQIEKALQHFPDHIVVLYLHATHETETRKHIEKKRIHDLEGELRQEGYDESEIVDILEKAKRVYNFQFDIARGSNKIPNELPTDKTENRLHNSIVADLKEIKDVHDEFPNFNVKIDHVLLNTGTEEDLINQMQNLLHYYSLHRETTIE